MNASSLTATAGGVREDEGGVEGESGCAGEKGKSVGSQ